MSIYTREIMGRCTKCGTEVSFSTMQSHDCVPAATPPQSKVNAERAAEYASKEYDPEKYKLYTPQTRGMLQVACANGALWGLSTARAERDAEVEELKRQRDEAINKYAACVDSRLEDSNRYAALVDRYCARKP